jgi:hypothetical protein
LAVIDEGGKYRSVRTPEEEKSILMKEMKALNAEERAAMRLILQEMLADRTPGDQTPSLMEVIGESEWKHKPVDLETFVKDPYFLGESCSNIYPVLLKHLKEVFSGNYNEIILTGSIGWGKTFFASIGACRMLYEMACLKDPQRSLGLAPNSNISILCLSVNESLAIKVAFDYIATKIEMSPFFEKHFPFKKMKKEMRFPKDIWVAARASTDTSALGLNVLGAIMDETNFLQKPAKNSRHVPGAPQHDQAETLYNAIKRRMKSRFERRGKLPAIMFLSSSKNTFDDFTAKRIRESKDDPHVYIMDYALWEVRPEDYDMENGFWVLVGNETSPSRIVPDDEVEEIRALLPEGAALVRVPVDFKADFARDLEGSIRDIAGRATAAMSPYVTRREKIGEMENAIPGRRHPFTTEIYDMSKGGTFDWASMVKPKDERLPGGQIHRVLRPIVSPTQVRHVHIDPALRGDCAGFTMAHVCGWKDVKRRNDDGLEHIERAPIYYIDVMLRIIPPIGSEIILGNIRRLVYELSTHGYIITRVTQDSYQSADSIQILAQKGYTSEIISVDTSIEPYDNFKLALTHQHASAHSPNLFFLAGRVG